MSAVGTNRAPRRPRSACTVLDDGQLIARCVARDEDAWRELMRRYSGLILSIPLKRGLGRDVAEEVFQSVATTLLERLHLLEDPECLPKWLMVTTSRRASAIAARDRRDEPLAEPESTAADSGPSPESQVSAEQLRHHVGEALRDLKPRDRDILRDLFYDELGYTEVARRHGLAVGSLGALRARALSRLRRALEQRGAL